MLFFLDSNEPVHMGYLGDEPAAREKFAKISQFLDSALLRIRSEGRRRITETVNLERVLGTVSVLETGPDDEIVWAQRRGKRWLSRFVKNRAPEATSLITVLLVAAAHGGYKLVDAYLGPFVPYEKTNPKHGHNRVSREFWDNHAFLWSEEWIIPDSEAVGG